jgi:flagellar M-ring protein FliF
LSRDNPGSGLGEADEGRLMSGREQAERLWTNLLVLGPRRLAALGVIGLTVFAVVGLGGLYLSRPQLEVLYSGLDREDVTRIGAALNAAGIRFDVNSEGSAVLVSYAQTAEARMLLAEKELPQSSNAGYELFDQLGSLGLTSFMQEVTRVRALEGEIARTIQTIDGIKAARVHIVMPDEGSFRRTRQPPSASVVIRSDTSVTAGSAQAIRHLVAAAVPAMNAEEVTVLNTDGVLLASGDDTENAAPGKMMSLEKSVAADVQEKIRESLTPYLGLQNFQVSVTARLNTDKRQTTETIFDPDSRVERSVRVVKENEATNNSSTQAPTSVAQNLPEDDAGGEAGEQSSAQNDRREEITNYELSSKTVTTVSEGFSVENLSIAVLVNRTRLSEALGGSASPEAISEQLTQIEGLVTSAAGFRADRGDQIKLTAVDFVADARALEPVPPVAMTELLVRQSGTVINAATILFVAFLLIWFGLRPATRAILARPPTPAPQALALASLDPDNGAAFAEIRPGQLMPAAEASLIDDLTTKMKRSPQKRLEQMVHFDDEQTAAILKQWMRQGASA